MHTAVTHYGTVVFLDRTDIGASQINLPNGECRNDPKDAVCCQEHFTHFSTSFSSSPIECGSLHAELQFTRKISTPMKKKKKNKSKPSWSTGCSFFPIGICFVLF
jgi:hypothetical protein